MLKIYLKKIAETNFNINKTLSRKKNKVGLHVVKNTNKSVQTFVHWILKFIILIIVYL